MNWALLATTLGSLLGTAAAVFWSRTASKHAEQAATAATLAHGSALSGALAATQTRAIVNFGPNAAPCHGEHGTECPGYSDPAVIAAAPAPTSPGTGR